MAAAFVRQATASGTGSSAAITITSALGNDILVASVAISGSGVTITGITCTFVTGLAKQVSGANGSLGAELWFGRVSSSRTSGTTFTITFSASCTWTANVTEYSGVLGTADVTGVSHTGTGTAASCAAYTTLTASDLMLVCEGHANGSSPSAQPTGYTALTYQGSGSTVGIQADYKLAATAGAQTATWTIGSVAYVALMVGLKLTAGSTTTLTPAAGSLTGTGATSAEKLAIPPAAATLTGTGSSSALQLRIGSGGSASLTETGAAGSITLSSGTVLTPSAATLLKTGVAAHLRLAIPPGAGLLTATGINSHLKWGIAPGPAALAETGIASHLKLAIPPGFGHAVFTGAAGAIALTSSKVVSPSSAVLTETGIVPHLRFGIVPSVGALNQTGIAAHLRLTLAPGAPGVLTLSGAAARLKATLAPAGFSLHATAFTASFTLRIPPSSGFSAFTGATSSVFNLQTAIILFRFAVPAELRRFSVVAEPRFFAVPVELRSLIVMAEPSLFAVPVQIRYFVVRGDLFISANKFATEVEFFSLDWSARIAGGAIASSTWDAPDPITYSNASSTTSSTQVKLAGGLAGQQYRVHNTVTLADGQVLQALLLLTIDR